MAKKGKNGKKVWGKSHWFVASAANWSVDTNLRLALNRVRRADGRELPMAVFRVPGKTSDAYLIDNYTPQVKGTEFIGNVNLEPKS